MYPDAIQTEYIQQFGFIEPAGNCARFLSVAEKGLRQREKMLPM